MQSVKITGRRAAILSLVMALGYSIPELFSTFGVLPHPQNLFWLFVPSLLLSPAFLVTMICLHYAVASEQRLWTAISIAFALLYAGCTSSVYFSQLTVILPPLMRHEIDETHLLAFRSRSYLMAIDCLGYFFMSLSTLFAAFAFGRSKENTWLHRSLLWNGLLLPILILAFFYPSFYYIGALWMITFPMAMINASVFFRKLPIVKLST